MASVTYILLLFMLTGYGSLYLRKPISQESRETEFSQNCRYIVRFNVSDQRHLLGSTTYMQVLNQVLDKGRNAPDALIYSYKESFTGFAARLTEEERKKLEGIYGILGVERSRNYDLHTTKSWDFLGFPLEYPEYAESDLIIGVLDTGIWPDLGSFRDDDLNPPPSRWRGKCQDIRCNNKIVGARAYYTGKDKLAEPFSVMDTNGHGTHVASTAAGRAVSKASFFGLARGIARGGVLSARIAVYKVCWTTTKGNVCPEHDILNAIDDAMVDGVDIISASLGSKEKTYKNAATIGSFRAMKKGILTVTTAGNDGPNTSTVENGAPWVLTVAATNTDRKFVADLELANGQTFTGTNINGFEDQQVLYTLVKAEKLKIGNSSSAGANRNNVNVITVNTETKVNKASKTNPRGVIAIGDDCPDDSPSFPLPGVCLTRSDGEKVKRYVKETRDPKGKILRGRTIKDSKAPVIASFSSRGPNPTSSDILKPDISAPGVNILAAWPPNVKPSDYSTDKRSTRYNILSGTSMACPHVSAIAVYVKSFHRDWSPSAIKSAIMTTATPMNRGANPNAEFDYGSGLLNPSRALRPGLVYNATYNDYVKFLCAEGYSESEIRCISDDKTATCSKKQSFTTKNLNYPSMSAKVASIRRFNVTFRRTLTNVESRESVYTSYVNSATNDLTIETSPSELSFSYKGQKKSFTITVSRRTRKVDTPVSLSLTWKDGKRKVRSPIFIYSGTSK